MKRREAKAGAPADAVEDLRAVLREKAVNHSLFYMHLYGETARAHARPGSAAAAGTGSVMPPARLSSRVRELVLRLEPHNNIDANRAKEHKRGSVDMQYLQPPRPGSPIDDIASSDDEDRTAVRRRSRDFSDDSAVEMEFAPRRHSTPRALSPPVLLDSGSGSGSGQRDRTLVEAHVVQLGRRGSEGAAARGRCVRTPSVVVSDYCHDSPAVAVGATKEEVAWLRAHSADSACSSCSTLSSRDDDFLDRPIAAPYKMS